MVRRPDAARAQRDAARARADGDRLPDGAGARIDAGDARVVRVRHPDRAPAGGDARRRSLDRDLVFQVAAVGIEQPERVRRHLGGLSARATADEDDGREDDAGDRSRSCSRHEQASAPDRRKAANGCPSGFSQLLFVGGLEWGKLARKTVRKELEDAFGAREVLQPVLAEVDKPLPRWKVVFDDVAGRAREEDLASVAGRGDAGAAVHRKAHVAAVIERRLAGMYSDPNTHLPPVWPRVLNERALCSDRRGNGVAGARKDDEERVALRVDLAASVLLECLAEQAAVLREDLAVPLPELALEPGRTLDVCEQERDSAAGQPGNARFTCFVHAQPGRHRRTDGRN